MRYDESRDKVTQKELKKSRGSYNKFSEMTKALWEKVSGNSSQLESIANNVNDTTVLCGDSWTAMNGSGSDVGESGFHYHSRRGFFDMTNIKLNHSLKCLKNLGVSGAISEEIKEQIPLAIALKPKIINILAGINDVVSVTSDETIENLMWMYEEVRKNDIILSIQTLPPRDTYGTDYLQRLQEINAFIYGYARDNRDVILTDIFIYLAAGDTLIAKSGMLQDGLHPSVEGTDIIATLLADNLDKYARERTELQGLNDNYSNILLNPALKGDNSGKADSFTIYGTPSATKAVSDDNIDADYQLIECVSGGTAVIYQPIDTELWSVGDTIGSLCELTFEGTFLNGISCRIRCRDSENNDLLYSVSLSNDTGEYSETSETLMHKTEEIVIPELTTTLAFEVRFSGIGTVKLRRPTVYKI